LRTFEKRGVKCWIAPRDVPPRRLLCRSDS
jgi:hypothetical protein